MTTAHGLHYPLALSSQMLPTDALFWYAEKATPELRPLVAGLLMLDRRPARERLRASVERWIARLPRLRQRVVEAPFGLGLPEWKEDEHFELDYHAREVILPHPASERHLLDFVGSVFATPLDPMRPLWEAYLIEGLASGKAACFFKVHHAVMDGVGSLAVFDALTQAHRNEVVRVPRAAPHAPSDAPGGLMQTVRETIGNAANQAAVAAAGAARVVLRPAAMVQDMGRAMRAARGLIADLTADTTDDPLAQASTGIGRRLDTMTLSLPRLVHIKDVLGATLNDVVLTAVAGAVGRYHARRRIEVVELHCMVPMSLRQREERHALGNRVGAFNVALPVGEADPLVRLARIRQQTGAAKGDHRGAAYPLLTQALSLMPSAAYRMLAQSATRHVNLVCTNMPGPPTERYLAGARVDRIHPFAPVALGVPLSIALMSYGDTYGIGIDTDPAAIPDVEHLHDDLRAAVDEIERCASPKLRRRAVGRGPQVATKSRRHRAPAAAP